MNRLQRKVKAAIAAVEEVFSDTSVSQQDTMDALLEMRADIDMKIECIKEDLRRD